MQCGLCTKKEVCKFHEKAWRASGDLGKAMDVSYDLKVTRCNHFSAVTPTSKDHAALLERMSGGCHVDLDWKNSVNTCVTLSPRDWGANHRDAWVYGILVGWDDESLAELAVKHRWKDEVVDRLKMLRLEYEKVS